MKRTLLTIIASSMLVFAMPAVASAAHGKHHHARHANAHRRHAKRARVLTFAPPAAPVSGAPAAPLTPATDTAGTVTSFTNGVLTITLTDLTVVSGKVTEQSELECVPVTPPPTPGDDDQGGGDDQNGRESGEHGGPSPIGIEQRDFQGDNPQQNGNDENEESCTTAALVPGAMVHEAELSLSSAGAVWEKVDLAK